MEVPRDDRQIKAAEASRRTGVVEDTAQEEGAATLHHAVGVNPKQHRGLLTLLEPAKAYGRRSTTPAALVFSAPLSLHSRSMAFACSYPIYADHPSVHQ